MKILKLLLYLNKIIKNIRTGTNCVNAFKGKSHEIGEGCRWCFWIDTFIFNLEFFFQSNFFKMASVRVRFSPGFPLGGGFPTFFAPAVFNFALWEIKCARQQLINTHVVLCVFLEYCRSQKIGFLRCSAYLLNTAGAKARQVALWEIPLFAEIRTPPEQLSSGHPSSKEQ
jgi:hypothetical protein